LNELNHKERTSFRNNSGNVKDETIKGEGKGKYACFTYIGKETKFIMKLFKCAKLQIAYKTNNTIDKLLTYKQKQNNVDISNEDGIFALKCPDCGKLYLGQTGNSF
jgi:hypothetical protein